MNAILAHPRPIYNKLIARLSAGITLLIAALIIISWIFPPAAGQQLFAADPTVKFNTALCLLLCAAALLLLDREHTTSKTRYIGSILNWVVLAIATLTLAEHLFSFDAGIDQFFWKETSAAPDTAPGRMSLTVSILFILLASVFLLLQKKRFLFLIQLILISGFVILSVVFLVSIAIVGKDHISVFRASTLHTSLALLLLYTGTLHSRPLNNIRFSFEKRMLATFSFIFLLFILVFLSLKKTYKRFNETSDLVTFTDGIILKAGAMDATIVEMQNSLRGYFITDNKMFLSEFKQKGNFALTQIRELQTLTTSNDQGQQTRLESILQMTTHYLDSRNRILEAHHRQALTLLKIRAVIFEGSDAITGIRNAIKSFQATEEKLLAQRKSENAVAISNAYRAVTLFQLVIAFLMMIGFTIIYRNARKRRSAENNLRDLNEELEKRVNEKTSQVIQKEKQYRLLVENMQEGIQVVGFDWKYLYVNNAYLQQSGHYEDDLTGKSFFEQNPGIEKKPIFNLLQQCMTDRSSARIELANNDRFFDISVEPVPEGLLILSMDITERRKAEDILRESEERQRLIMNNAMDAIICMNTNGKVIFWNPQAEKIFGWTEAEALDADLSALILPSSFNNQNANGIENLFATGNGHLLNKVLELDAINRAGKSFPVELTLLPIRQKNEAFFCAFVRDISYRKQFIQQLQSGKEKLANAHKIAKLAGWEWDIKKGLVYPEKGLLEIVEWNNGRELTADDFISLIHPDDVQSFNRELRASFENETDLNAQFRILTRDKQIKYLHIVSERVLTDTFQGFNGTIQDVSKLKRSELMLKQLNVNLEKKAAELRASNAELERFAFVASHDLQEPLRMVTSFLSLLEEETEGKLDDGVKEYIRFAVDGAERMKKLIEALLEYSRIGEYKSSMSGVDCNVILENVTSLLKLTIQETNAIIRIPPLPVITAVEPQVQQVFQNLVSNALKYHNHAAPEIEIGYTEETDKWIFYVRDNGIGIDAKYFEKIFIIFQRLHDKKDYSGTGIGLAFCKKIAEKHGGDVWVESVVGKGSTFYFSIAKWLV